MVSGADPTLSIFCMTTALPPTSKNLCNSAAWENINGHRQLLSPINNLSETSPRLTMKNSNSS